MSRQELHAKLVEFININNINGEHNIPDYALASFWIDCLLAHVTLSLEELKHSGQEDES